MPPEQWGPLLRGTLRIIEMDRITNNFKRNILKAEPWLAYGETRMGGLALLSDPCCCPTRATGS